MLKEHPILFSAPMVRAILAGRKTQTRRIIKPQPSLIGGSNDAWQLGEHVEVSGDGMASHLFHNVYGVKGTPYGALYEDGGDRLWVRESHKLWDNGKPSQDSTWEASIKYKDGTVREVTAMLENTPSTCPTYEPNNWRPSIHMPRWASRITLEITDVRAERLQDISESDAKAEGVSITGVGSGLKLRKHQRAFKILWCQINGQESWDANPWVWVIGFRKLEGAAK